MNQKELSELKRRFRPDKSAIHRIYGCFVNGNQEIVSYLDESMGRMPEEESAQYLGFLKKALSGTLGKQLIDIVFSTQQVADSQEHKLLSALRDSQLKDAQARETFYRKIIDALELDGNYLILLAHDAYDVPRRGKDDRLQEDSDTVFSYLVCCVCPVKDSKVELGYFPGENEFHSRAGQVVAPPELGFLFPAFDGRAANLYNALFYSKKADQIHQEFIDAVFHTEPPMSAAEQKEAFQSALREGLGDACTVEVVQAIHERLLDRMARHKESKDPEPLEVTAQDVAAILRDCGVGEEPIAAFQEECRELVAMESAILVEAGFTNEVDKVVMVYAPREVRLARAVRRDAATREQVEKRIQSQLDDDKKRETADFVIVNDGETPLIPQVLNLISSLSQNH